MTSLFVLTAKGLKHQSISDGSQVDGVEVTMQMAQSEGWTSNSKWRNMPELMLAYRASAFFAVLRMGADIAEQEHSLLIFRTDAVGLHGLQTLQGSELLSHGRLPLLGMTTEEDEHKGC